MLGGYPSVDALALAMGLRGAGRTKLYAAERDEHVLPYPTMREIADCCGLPVEFFTADFSRLPEISDNPRTVIARETAAAVARAAERRAASDANTRARRREAQ